MTNTVSVIICSFKRHELLQRTLDHFGACHRSGEGIELLVVENSPVSDRRRIELPKHIQSRTIICNTIGLSAARNAGIAESNGEYIAFLDDDALTCEGWCYKLGDVFGRIPHLALGGKVIPEFGKVAIPTWFYADLTKYLSCIDWSNVDRTLKKGEWIVGANMAFRRSVFETYGNFDLSLGRRGDGNLLSNEEIALFEKIGRENIYYDPSCWVRHIIPEDRIEISWFRRRVFWQALSDVLAGIEYQSTREMIEEYRTISVQMPPECRNINMLSFAPRDPDEFRTQLRGIYLLARIGHAGFPHISLS